MHRSVPLATALLLLPALTSCSSAIGQDALEQQVAAALEEQAGARPDVTCPGELEADVDASTECTATDPDTGEEAAFRVTVTGVGDDTADFRVEPAE